MPNEQSLISTLRTTGIVVIRGSRTKLILLLPLAVLFVIAGVALIATRDPFHVIIGAVTIVFFGVICIPVILWQLLRPRELRIDREGITILPAKPPTTIPWGAVNGIIEFQVSSTKNLLVAVDAEFERVYADSLNPASRRLHEANKALVGGQPAVTLPANFQGGPNLVKGVIGAGFETATGRPLPQ